MRQSLMHDGHFSTSAGQHFSEQKADRLKC
jgi:hypothetical protein